MDVNKNDAWDKSREETDVIGVFNKNNPLFTDAGKPPVVSRKKPWWKRVVLRKSSPKDVHEVSRHGRAGLLWKYWYVFVVVIILVAALTGWLTYRSVQEANWNKALDYYGRADYAKAAKLLDGMAMPTDEKRLTAYAQTMLATRQLDKALPAYTKLYADKKDPAVKIIIGNIYNEQKKYDAAAATYSELIAANPGYIQAYVNLATLYKLQGKSDDAIAVAKKGVQANPKSVVLHELLISMLLEKKESPEYQQAVQSLKQLNPQDPIFEVLK